MSKGSQSSLLLDQVLPISPQAFLVANLTTGGIPQLCVRDDSLNAEQPSLQPAYPILFHPRKGSTNFFSSNHLNLLQVTALENEASGSEVHKLKSEDIVDFETWRSMRKKEKAQEELDGLLGNLRKAQREREFHFRPKEVESVR